MDTYFLQNSKKTKTKNRSIEDKEIQILPTATQIKKNMFRKISITTVKKSDRIYFFSSFNKQKFQKDISNQIKSTKSNSNPFFFFPFYKILIVD
jgi:hypothetical protein